MRDFFAILGKEEVGSLSGIPFHICMEINWVTCTPCWVVEPYYIGDFFPLHRNADDAAEIVSLGSQSAHRLIVVGCCD